MKLLTLLFALATPTAAIQIPKHLPDGDYDVIQRTPDSALEFWQRKSPDPPGHFVKRAKKKWWADQEKLYRDRRQKKHKDKNPKGYSIAGSGEVTAIVNDTGPVPQVERVALDSKPNSVLPFAFDRRACFKVIPETFAEEEYKQAKQAFVNYCSTHKWAYFYASVSVKGNVVVYTCRRQNSWGTCSEGEYEFAEAIIDASCGEGKPGYTYSTKYDQEYGRAWRGVPVCEGDENGGLLAPFNNRENLKASVKEINGKFTDRNKAEVKEHKMEISPGETAESVGEGLSDIWNEKQDKRAKMKRNVVHLMLLE
jgi:hypothetical protein